MSSATRSVGPAARFVGTCFAAGLLLAACNGSNPAEGVYPVSLPAAVPSGQLLAVSVVDQAGIVASVGMAATIGVEPVEAVAGSPTTLRISWTGGECDDRTTLVLGPFDNDYRIAVHIHTQLLPFGCDAGAVPRAIDLHLRQPLDPTRLSVVVTYP